MLYLDCADRAALAPLLATGLFDGVTTNPSVLAKAGLGYRDLPALYEFATGHGARLFFAQAVGTTTDDVRRSAHELAGLGPQLRVKLGCSLAALPVARELAAQGHQTLITAIYHPAQTLAALAAGGAWIAPYVARAERQGTKVETLVGQSARIIADNHSSLRILAASLHSLDQVAQAAAAGAVDVTLNGDVATRLLEEPQTMEALAHFEDVHLGAGRG